MGKYEELDEQLAMDYADELVKELGEGWSPSWYELIEGTFGFHAFKGNMRVTKGDYGYKAMFDTLIPSLFVRDTAQAAVDAAIEDAVRSVATMTNHIEFVVPKNRTYHYRSDGVPNFHNIFSQSGYMAWVCKVQFNGSYSDAAQLNMMQSFVNVLNKERA